MLQTNPLKSIVKEGCFAVTGSDPFVLKATMKYAKAHNAYYICEATVNQVNQFGGYTGMRPADYARLVQKIAEEIDFPIEKVILSGDHLGPFVWQNLDSETAMSYSRELVKEYVAAGFRKIHLDPTMPLADDNPAKFGNDVIASRAAELAVISEETYEKTKKDTPWTYRPAYVIGSEVPVPGGTETEEGIRVTTPEDLTDSINCFRQAFESVKLAHIFDDVVAVVAQIGIEFSDESVHEYDTNAARELSAALRKYPNLRFESHSSDYQTPECLYHMVKDGVGILKVGPEITFKYREALFALARIEDELAPLFQYEPSHFIDVLEQEMLTASPNYWEKYYHGTPEQLRLKRKYSFSDRSRYYFASKPVSLAIRSLIGNLSTVEIPLTIISQYLPVQYEKIREGLLKNDPVSILEDACQSVQHRYYQSLMRAANEIAQVR